MANKISLAFAASASYYVPGSDAGKPGFASIEETKEYCKKKNQENFNIECEYLVKEGLMDEQGLRIDHDGEVR